MIYLFSAYLIIWIVLFGYVFFVQQQVSDLRAQLTALRRAAKNSVPGSKAR